MSPCNGRLGYDCGNTIKHTRIIDNEDRGSGMYQIFLATKTQLTNQGGPHFSNNLHTFKRQNTRGLF